MKITIRPEEPKDIDLIRSVVFRAFRSQNEPRLIDRLRKEVTATLSLVAEVDGRIAGHILFSPMSLDPDIYHYAIFGLAPLAVAPEFQKQGIGSKLVRQGLDLGLSLHWSAVFVLGSSGYYQRFGFETASKYALYCEYDVLEEDFMVISLRAHTLDLLHGTAFYHPIFKEIGI